MQTTAPTTRPWTLLSLLEWGASYLATRNFEDARLNVELLLAHVLQLSRIGLYTQFDRPLTPRELASFKTLFQRRIRNEPLQYIMGETEFMGIPLWVDPSVLIPRPETEELVQRVIDEAKGIPKPHVAILDIGTGSGNIPIAIARNVPQAKITSMDVSTAALATASRNIQRHRLTTIALIHADVFEQHAISGIFDIIVTNPTYISVEEHSSLQPEVRNYEPHIATTDNGDGFRFIRRIGSLAMELLIPGGIVFMEIAYNQSVEARRILETAGLTSVEVFDDLSGIPRIVKARRSS